MRYKFIDQNDCTQGEYKYNVPLNGQPGTWCSAPKNAQKDNAPCGVGLHLMKSIWPVYAPAKYRCFEAEGKGLLGQDKEKARYRKVRLLRELSPQEIDQGVDDVFTARFGKSGIFLPVAWMRTATYLDRPLDTEQLITQIRPILRLLNCKDEIAFVSSDSLWALLWDSLRDSLWASLRASLRASLWDSLRDSLRASLGDSLWASLFYERGFALAGQPKSELSDLLEIWKAGACPLGWDNKGKFLVLITKK